LAYLPLDAENKRNLENLRYVLRAILNRVWPWGNCSGVKCLSMLFVQIGLVCGGTAIININMCFGMESKMFCKPDYFGIAEWFYGLRRHGDEN
jgi:hypothetical protein